MGRAGRGSFLIITLPRRRATDGAVLAYEREMVVARRQAKQAFEDSEAIARAPKGSRIVLAAVR